MRGTSNWRTWLFTAGLAVMALAPNLAFGDNLGASDPEFPLPISHDRYDRGGFFIDMSFVMYRQNNYLQHQIIAQRGFIDVDGTLTGGVINPITGHVTGGSPGTFIGSGKVALDAKDAGGPGTYAPGTKIGLGWKFEDGGTIEINWLHLFNTHYFHFAGLIPPGNAVGPNLADTFLTSPVFNFNHLFAGPDFKVPFGAPGATFGIWNAASEMHIELLQRFDQYEITYRQPITESDCYRCYGLVGARFAWFWDRFLWRTTDIDTMGNSGPTDVAIFTNIVSNRMYGPHIGLGQELYLGYGFAVGGEIDAALLLDVVKERASFELGAKDFPGSIKRSITDYTIVPEISGKLQVMWYPIEGIQFKVGYDLMTFFNTIASPHPVTFDFGGVDPAWQHQTRFLDGLEIGLSIVF